MKAEQVKQAADALARYEALIAVFEDVNTKFPHGALPISFPSAGTDDDSMDMKGAMVFYSRELFLETLTDLIECEERILNGLGVDYE